MKVLLAWSGITAAVTMAVSSPLVDSHRASRVAQEWVDKLMREYQREPPPGYKRVTLSQLERADKYDILNPAFQGFFTNVPSALDDRLADLESRLERVRAEMDKKLPQVGQPSPRSR